jgi:hypothetical protein
LGTHSTYWRRSRDRIVPQTLEKLIEYVQKQYKKVLSDHHHPQLVEDGDEVAGYAMFTFVEGIRTSS